MSAFLPGPTVFRRDCAKSVQRCDRVFQLPKITMAGGEHVKRVRMIGRIRKDSSSLSRGGRKVASLHETTRGCEPGFVCERFISGHDKSFKHEEAARLKGPPRICG